jgi:hypothetical protein
MEFFKLLSNVEISILLSTPCLRFAHLAANAGSAGVLPQKKLFHFPLS